MSYVDDVLMENERVLAVGRVHWFVYILPCFMAVLAGILALALYFIQLPVALSFFLAGPAIGFGLRSWLYAFSTELAVTNKRIIAKSGLIARYTVEIRNDKVESLKVVQSITGRIFNYGSLYVSGTGGTQAPIVFISNPLRFRSAALTGESARDNSTSKELK